MADIPLFTGQATYTPSRFQPPVESLSDVALKAAKLGQMTPSVATSIAQGITGGIEAYQGVRLNEANIEAQQARAQVLQAQAQEAQLENQINQLERDSVIAAKRLEKQVRVRELEVKKSELETQSEMLSIMSDPLRQKELLAPQYQSQMNEGQKEALVNELWSSGQLSEEEYLTYSSRLQYEKNFKAKQNQQREAAKDLATSYEKARTDAGLTKLTALIETQTGKKVDPYNQKEYFDFINKLGLQQDPDVAGQTVATFEGQTYQVPLEDETISTIQRLKDSQVGLGIAPKEAVVNPYLEGTKAQEAAAQKEREEAAAIEAEKNAPGFFGKAASAIGDLASRTARYSAGPMGAAIGVAQDVMTSFSGAPQATSPAQQVEQQQTVIAPSVNNAPVDAKKNEILNKIQGKKYEASSQKFKERREQIEASKKNISLTNTASVQQEQDILRAITPDVVEVFDFAPRKISNEVVQRVNADPLLANQPAIIKAIAAVESKGVREAKSPTGVKGLLQVTKATADQYGLDRDIPEQNVQAGIREFTRNLRTLKSPPLALAAYNAGIGTISDSIARTKSMNWDVIKADLKDNLPPAKYKEVVDYPERVLSYLKDFTNPESADDLYTVALMEV